MHVFLIHQTFYQHIVTRQDEPVPGLWDWLAVCFDADWQQGDYDETLPQRIIEWLNENQIDYVVSYDTVAVNVASVTGGKPVNTGDIVFYNVRFVIEIPETRDAAKFRLFFPDVARPPQTASSSL